MSGEAVAVQDPQTGSIDGAPLRKRAGAGFGALSRFKRVGALVSLAGESERCDHASEAQSDFDK